jgi:hypothetical protein
MIQLGDELLGLDGRLDAAVMNMSDPDYESTPEPFVLNVI